MGIMHEIDGKVDAILAMIRKSQSELDVLGSGIDDLQAQQLAHSTKTNDVLARLAQIRSLLNTGTTDKKLGKKPPKIDSRTLKLAKYFEPGLSAPASACDWTGGITSWGMMLNDQLGDCTIAACGHPVQSWTKLASGLELTLPDWVILDYYEAWAGYRPDNPSTDQGAFEIDVLNYWRKYGFGLRKNHTGANKLLAYADPDPGNVTHVKQAISLFGGVYIGVSLPITAQNQSTWSLVGDGKTGDSAPGSWGGHAVWCPKYTPNYVTCVTWGGLTNMTWDFWRAYCDEAHALLSPDFIATNGISPSQFNLAQLKTDLALVTG